jgi:hypothetical protein
MKLLDLDSIFDNEKSRAGWRIRITPDDLPEEWGEVYEERAAIREYDGEATCEVAEHDALLEILELMKTNSRL